MKRPIHVACTRLLCCLILLLAGAQAAAEPVFQELTSYGAFITGSVIVKVQDLDSADAWRLEYRPAGTGTWKRGHDPVRYDANHLAASLFDLQPSRTYDVRVLLEVAGIDPIEAGGSLTTRAEWSLPNAVRNIWVTNDAELRGAVQGALPGDHIHLAPGEYHAPIEPVGRPGQPGNGRIVLRSYSLENPAVVYGGVHLYQCPWWTLHGLSLMGGIGTHGGAISLRGSNHAEVVACVVREASGDDKGGSAIYINHDNETPGPDKTGSHLIMDCILLEDDHVPGGDYRVTERQTAYGIRQYHQVGGFTIIRGNFIRGFSDGISPGADEGQHPLLEAEDYDVLESWPNQNIDIYDNVIYDVSDDGIETDGHMCNARVFNNYIGSCINALSAAPTWPGPVFFVRNRLHGFTENSMKFNTAVPGTTRKVFFYHNTIIQRPEAFITFYRGLPSRSEDVVLRNNIIYSDHGHVVSTDIASNEPCEYFHKNHDYDYDLLWSPLPQYEGITLFRWGYSEWWDNQRFDNFADFQEATANPTVEFACPDQRVIPIEANGIFAEPQIQLQSIPGYSSSTFIIEPVPLATSPAIDAAVAIPGINDDYIGDGPDIGAYELGSDVDPPRPIPYLDPVNAARAAWRIYD